MNHTLRNLFPTGSTQNNRNNTIQCFLTNHHPPRTVEINSEVLRQMVQSSTSNIGQVSPGCWVTREILKIYMVYISL